MTSESNPPPGRRPGDTAPGIDGIEPLPAPVVEEPVEPHPPDEPELRRPYDAAPGIDGPEPLPAPVVEDYKDQYLRAVAEMENVRKRAKRDVAAAEARGVARLARELLPALDNFDRALAAAEAEEQDEEHHLTKGIRLVQQDLSSALSRMGIQAYSPKGEVFDPHQHEAVAQQPVEGVPSGTIVEVYQPGYRYGGDVLRAAKVVVAA
jgi:molecular chaperone GrpE